MSLGWPVGLDKRTREFTLSCRASPEGHHGLDHEAAVLEGLHHALLSLPGTAAHIRHEADGCVHYGRAGALWASPPGQLLLFAC